VGAATAAHAQTPYTGWITGHFGAAAGGDVRDWTATPGASLAVTENGSGLGAELDLSHAGDFDSESFADSSITTAMLSLVAFLPVQQDRLRPYITVGAGILRVRVAFSPGESSTGNTEPAWSAGGGIHYMLNEAIGVRGDVRYFRHFSSQDIPLGDNGVLDFVRTSIGFTYSWPLR
jgi:opacity protein-like surface antigen